IVKTINNKTISCKVVVKSNIIQVEKITIDKGAKFTTKSDLVQFKATILPTNANNKNITWSTSNIEMGSISSKGAWTGKKGGICTITATASNGIKGTCELTYDHIAVTGAEIESPIKMKIGEKVTLKPTILPKNASNKNFKDEVKVTGEKGGIIHKTVLGSHQIEALKGGKYTVTMYTIDGNFPVLVSIIVEKETPILPFGFSLTTASIDMSDAELFIEMKNVSGDINWTLSDVSIATVETFINLAENKTYALIKGLKAGVTTITATLSNGSSAACEITVTESTVSVTSISVGQKSYTIKEGEIVDLKVIILPENATNKDYTFSTDNNNIVSFENGKIKGLKEGNTNISLTTADGTLISTGMISLTVVSNDPVSEECVDADGKVYKTVVIGNQTWMAENYAYLPKVNVATEESDKDACYYVYDYSETNVSKAKETTNYKIYGVLYNKKAALDNAPAGWHLPTDEEWKELEITMGMTQEEADKKGYYARGTEEIANKFKSLDYWGKYYKGNNESGMNIRPAGKISFGQFKNLETKTVFWCNTVGEYSDISFQREFLDYANGIKRRDNAYNPDGCSVRYVKNK
ncbi:MAG: FISUMP domain-containing protein, partial [Marinifilaceae bacterium]